MTYLIHALAAASLLAGCAASPSAPPSKDQPMSSNVTLQPERSVALGPSSLRYDGVEDSRCPPGMKCVWAGELAYKFTLSGPAGQEMFGLTAAKPSFASSTVPGATIALGQSDMPPVSTTGSASPSHPVTITITRK
jgi:hypothetical protein